MYSIGTVQERTGLTARQIRYYESTGLITVQRTEGKQRRFTDEDIQRLLTIKGLIKENLDVQTIKRMLATPKSTSAIINEESKESNYQKPFFGDKLTSLYPVSNRAELLSLVNSIEIKLTRDKD